jgi:endonuclease/exonuclease/phosphatase family metal-dependent hydrolase
MRIAAYNLRAGGRRGRRVHWQRLLDTFAPEILLVQETHDPARYLPPDVYAAHARRLHWRPAPGRAWGSALFVRSGRLTPLALPCYPGHVVAAEVTGSAWSRVTGRPLRLASLHVPAPYKRPMGEILDVFAALAPTHDWILGGDFNLAVGVRHAGEPLPSDPPWLLQRLRREFNLMSCWQAVHPNRDLAQTLRWSGNPALPYHCDGVFVPAAWYRYLDDCQVISDPEWDALSDHNPVVVTLSGDPAPA